MDNGITIDDANRELAKINAEMAKLQSEKADLQATMRVLHRLGRRSVASPVVSEQLETFAGVVIDLSGAKNLRQKVVRIFKAMDGPLNIWDVAKYIVEQGHSNATVKNLRSSISNVVKDDPDFTRVGSEGEGLFKYTPADENLLKLTPTICDSEYNTK